MNSYTAGIKEKLETIAGQTQDLAETAVKLAILETTERLAKLVSTVIVISILLLLANFVLLIIGLGVAHWIGEAMNDLKMGFFIVSGIYLAIMILILLSGKKLVVPYFRNIIIKKLYE